MEKVLNRLYSGYLIFKSQFLSNWTIGNGTRIDRTSLLECASTGTIIFGHMCGVRRFCNFKVRSGAKLEIGDRVAFNDNCNITVRENVSIGNDVLFGPNVVIVDHDHEYHSYKWKTDFVSRSIIIGNNVWIGANVIILKGSIIQDDSIIAAGTVVKGVVSKQTIFYENKVNKERNYRREAK